MSDAPPTKATLIPRDEALRVLAAAETVASTTESLAEHKVHLRDAEYRMAEAFPAIAEQLTRLRTGPTSSATTDAGGGFAPAFRFMMRGREP